MCVCVCVEGGGGRWISYRGPGRVIRNILTVYEDEACVVRSPGGSPFRTRKKPDVYIALLVIHIVVFYNLLENLQKKK